MNSPADRFVREPERHEITGVSRTQWWRLEKAGQVPRRRQLSPNIVAWRLSELMDWVTSRVEAACWLLIFFAALTLPLVGWAIA